MIKSATTSATSVEATRAELCALVASLKDKHRGLPGVRELEAIGGPMRPTEIYAADMRDEGPAFL